MFSNNDMISVRQLKRQMVLSFIGILLLEGTKEAAAGGGNGILGFVLGSVLLAAYLFLLVKTAEVYSEPKRYLGSPGTWILKGVCLSFLALTGGVQPRRHPGLRLRHRGKPGTFYSGKSPGTGKKFPGAEAGNLAASADRPGERADPGRRVRMEGSAAAGISHAEPDDRNRHSRRISRPGGYHLAGGASLCPAVRYREHPVLRSLYLPGGGGRISLGPADPGGGGLAFQLYPLGRNGRLRHLLQAAAGYLRSGFSWVCPAGCMGEKEGGK